MRRFSFLLVTAALFTTIIAAGCQGKGRSQKLPDIGIPLDEMNVKLRWYVPPEANTFKIGDHLALVVENITNTPILLPQDYGVKIFTQQDGWWISVRNDIEYPVGETLVLPKEQQMFGGVMVVVNPDVKSNQPVTVRVVVIGTVTGEDGQPTGETAGAYVDVILNP